MAQSGLVHELGTGEYFAQSTSAYFGRPYSSSEDDKKNYTRDWLKKNDAAMCETFGDDHV